MVRRYVPVRGDIVHLQFDPAAGHEMKGPHFAFVVSGRAFNSLGLALLCPISQGAADSARTFGTVVSLMGSGAKTSGAVHCHHLKSLDWRSRSAQFVESLPESLIGEILARIQAIVLD